MGRQGLAGRTIAVVLLLGGCDQKKDAAPHAEPSPTAAVAAEPGPSSAPRAPTAPSEIERVEACSVRLSGAAEKTIVGRVSLDPLASPNQDSGVATDYWLSDAERESAQRMMEKATGVKRSPGQATMLTMTLNCGDEHGSVHLMPARLTTSELPRAPGKYAVIPNDAKPEQKGFQTVINTQDGEMYLAESGEVSFTQFDERRLAGTFHIKARGRFKKGTLVVDGKFDFPCEAQVGDRCRALAKP